MNTPYVSPPAGVPRSPAPIPAHVTRVYEIFTGHRHRHDRGAVRFSDACTACDWVPNPETVDHPEHLADLVAAGMTALDPVELAAHRDWACVVDSRGRVLRRQWGSWWVCVPLWPVEPAMPVQVAALTLPGAAAGGWL